MIRRPPRSTLDRSSAASDVYKRQMNENPEALALARIQAFNNTITTKQFEFNWELDTTHLTVLPWLGYEAIESKSDVSGLPRITYDHDRPTSVDVPWTAHAKPTITLEKPVGYLIPQAWTDVIDRLALENVVMEVVGCLLYTSPSPRDRTRSRMPSSA